MSQYVSDEVREKLISEKKEVSGERVQAAVLFSNGIGIGIAFGEALQGPIGSKERKEFTVIGDVVITDSRVEGLTKCFDAFIVVTQEVYRELDEDQQRSLAKLGEEQFKGRETPVRVYGSED